MDGQQVYSLYCILYVCVEVCIKVQLFPSTCPAHPLKVSNHTVENGKKGGCYMLGRTKCFLCPCHSSTPTTLTLFSFSVIPVILFLCSVHHSFILLSLLRSACKVLQLCWLHLDFSSDCWDPGYILSTVNCPGVQGQDDFIGSYLELLYRIGLLICATANWMFRGNFIFILSIG